MPLKRFPRRLRFWPQRKTAIATIISIALAGSSGLQAKRKDDVIVLRNGDKITGEIKKLANGILYFKADYMANAVQIDWARVARLDSGDEYNVFLTSGERLRGTIEEALSSVPDSADFTIIAAGRTLRVREPEVVEFVPVEDTFLHQLTGSIDYGFAFTGGNDATQSSLSGDVAYRTAKSFSKLTGSSVFSAQSGAKNSGRNTVDFQYMKALDTRWYAGALVDLLNSDQQDLTFRGSFGGGVGRDLIRETTTSLQVLAGAVFTREYYSVNSGGQPQDSNAEGVLRVNFAKQTFRTMQMQAQASLFPSITTPGRIRFGTEASMSFEIVRNFFWKFSVYENYDTRPPVTAPKNDFGTSTSVGWKF